MKNGYHCIALLTIIVIYATFSLAQASHEISPEEIGLNIAKRMDERDSGWIYESGVIEMILKNSQGDESRRVLEYSAMEVQGDGDKSLTIIKNPKDVMGTAFLSFSHPRTSDDQWLFLPALRRVKRISSENKSGSFMGSEFAYEDFASQDLDKYTYKFLREGLVNGSNGFIIERYPVFENSGYSKQLVHIDAKEYRPFLIEYYDRKGEILKILSYLDYKLFPNNKWRAEIMVMKNLQTKKTSTLIWQDHHFKFDNFSKNTFTVNALKRIR